MQAEHAQCRACHQSQWLAGKIGYNFTEKNVSIDRLVFEIWPLKDRHVESLVSLANAPSIPPGTVQTQVNGTLTAALLSSDAYPLQEATKCEPSVVPVGKDAHHLRAYLAKVLLRKR